MPDHSPSMLSAFLRARIAFASAGLAAGKRMDATRRAKAKIRKAAGVTATQFEMAWMGRLAPESDALWRLWRALGVEKSERAGKDA